MTNDPIIVGWEGGDRSRDALALAAALAKVSGAKVLVAHAFYSPAPAYPLPDDYANRLHAAADAQVEGIPRRLLEGVGFEARSLPGQSPARALHDLAEDTHAALVVLGSSHHGPVGRVLPGGVADRFLHGAPCPVAIAPKGYASAMPGPIETVAVGFDGSHDSEPAVLRAAELARDADATLRVVVVDEPLGYAAYGEAASILEDVTHTERDWLHAAVERIRAELPPELPVNIRYRKGEPAVELLAETERGVDLFVLGSRGYGPVGRVLLGGTASKIARSASCPLLVVPR